MEYPRPNAVLDFIRGQLTESTADGLSDPELLGLFATRHDEGAFKVILQRYGPTVMRICLCALKGREDAEDVFQATFLVLARKAGSLQWPESVGPWLYGVAHRLSQEARRKQARQQAREARAKPKSAEDPLTEITGRELVGILEEEMAGLPERYRLPLLLCCLDGKSGDEAARCLRCSPSTLKRRLRHARELLQRRLDRRGITISLTALAALLLHNTTASCVAPALAAATVRAASLLASGSRLTAGLASPQALALASKTNHSLLLTKFKITLALLVVGSGLMAGTYVALWQKEATLPEASKPGNQVVFVRDPNDPIQSEELLPEHALSKNGLLSARPVQRQPVHATIETSLRTAPGEIRQFAFDGDPDSFFGSAHNATRTDHFTVLFDQPVSVKSVTVTTGRPLSGSDRLDAGVLEGSTDGNSFTKLAQFEGGVGRVEAAGLRLMAIRLRPTLDLQHPLTVREFAIESDPPVAAFKYPVEVVVDVTEAPEMKPWAESAARVCELAYPMINDELRSDGFKPPRLITVRLKNDYLGVAETPGGGQITASADYFKTHPDDVGALVYLTVHAVQGYPSYRNPRWLADGIADYVRFFKFEPGKLRPRNPDLERFDSSSRATAAFLAYLAMEYDRGIVRKINHIMRQGVYSEEIFQALTGKTVRQLDDEWRDWLRSDLALHGEPEK